MRTKRTRATLLLYPRVGVKPWNNEAHTQPREYHQRESQQRKVCAASSPPAVSDPRVQEACVSHPRYNRANFLRVPSPITTPRLVRPYRASDKQQRKKRECYADGSVQQRINRLQRRKRRKHSLTLS